MTDNRTLEEKLKDIEQQIEETKYRIVYEPGLMKHFTTLGCLVFDREKLIFDICLKKDVEYPGEYEKYCLAQNPRELWNKRRKEWQELKGPIPENKKEIQQIIYDLIEEQKAKEDPEIHDLGMLDGMLVIECAINGMPWPL